VGLRGCGGREGAGELLLAQSERHVAATNNWVGLAVNARVTMCLSNANTRRSSNRTTIHEMTAYKQQNDWSTNNLLPTRHVLTLRCRHGLVFMQESEGILPA
jgi:hypothetical protein